MYKAGDLVTNIDLKNLPKQFEIYIRTSTTDKKDGPLFAEINRNWFVSQRIRAFKVLFFEIIENTIHVEALAQ